MPADRDLDNLHLGSRDPANQVPQPASSIKHDPINHCIYCGRDDLPLTEEHIIPEGLGGEECLPKSSCPVCQEATSAAENLIGRSLLPLLRSHGIRGKKKSKSSKVQMKGIDASGRKFSANLEPEEIGLLGVIPEWTDTPTFFDIGEDKDDVGVDFIYFANVEKVAEFQQPGAWLDVVPYYFAQMAAKIAHSFAVARLGYSKFEPFLTDIIRGKSKDWWRYIGRPPTYEKNEQTAPVFVELFYLSPPHDDILLTRIRFFEALGGPVYDVITGRKRS